MKIDQGIVAISPYYWIKTGDACHHAISIMGVRFISLIIFLWRVVIEDNINESAFKKRR